MESKVSLLVYNRRIVQQLNPYGGADAILADAAGGTTLTTSAAVRFPTPLEAVSFS